MFHETLRKGKQIVQELDNFLQKMCNGKHEIHSFQFNIGEATSFSTLIAMQLLIGQLQKDLIKEILNKQDEVTEEEPCFIFSFKCRDSSVAKDTFENLVNEFLEFCVEVIPDSEYQFSLLKFFITTPDQTTLNFGVAIQLGVIEPILKQYIELTNLVLGDSESCLFSKICVEFGTTFGLQHLIADPDKCVKEIFIERNKGTSIKLLIDASEVLMKNIKDVFVKFCEDKLNEEIQDSKKVKFINLISPFILLKESKFHFNFKSLASLQDNLPGTFIDEILDQIPFIQQSFNDIQQQYPVSSDMLYTIPFLQDLINFAKDQLICYDLDNNQLICNASITFSIPKACFVMNIESQGELSDYLMYYK